MNNPPTASSHMSHFQAVLHPIQPYAFDLLLNILSRYAHPTLDIARQGAYWRVLRAGDGLALARVTAQNAALKIDLVEEAGQVDRQSVLDTLRHILHIDANRADFYNLARQDPALWPVIEPLIGLPELRTASVFEALAQAIIEQQIAWVTAQRAQRWLVEWGQNRLTHAGIDHFAFPTPEQIAAATIDDLKPLKITFKRMALLIEVAKQVAAGQLDLEGLRKLPPSEAYAALLRIKGIGHWSAVVTLERALGYHVGVAHNDVALQAAANRYFYGGQGRIPAATVEETFARYGEHAGTAAHFTLLRWVLDQYPILGDGAAPT